MNLRSSKAGELGKGLRHSGDTEGRKIEKSSDFTFRLVQYKYTSTR